MKKAFRKLSVGALLVLAASAASAGEVVVTYIQPENFSDLPTGGEREETLRNLSAHFVKLGAKLPAGQHLRIDVLDVDMAGYEQPSGARTDMRVKTREAWPRISLQYSLESNGKVISTGPGELRDTSFMDRPNRYMDHDTLRFEKKMVDTWFEKTILPAAGR